MPAKMIPLPDDGKGEDYSLDSACIICGKSLPEDHNLFIHLVEGGGMILAAGEEYDDDPGDLGLHPVGAGCVHRHKLKGYVHKYEETKR